MDPAAMLFEHHVPFTNNYIYIYIYIYIYNDEINVNPNKGVNVNVVSFAPATGPRPPARTPQGREGRFCCGRCARTPCADAPVPH
jgi:hypothetical protein